MKNIKLSIITIVLCLVIAIPFGLKAQHLEVGPFVGYETGGRYLQVWDIFGLVTV